MKNEDFNRIVDTICQTTNLQTIRTVVEKELLHYDILFALSQSGLLKTLTFQGGTALRLCYQLGRFSEDLDLVGGTEFSNKNLVEVKTVIEEYIGKRYGLEVLVKEPKKSKDTNVVEVSKWQIVVLTHPAEKHIPKQKIRLKIANVPAYTRALRPIMKNYDYLPDGYSQIFLYVETLEEILADKTIAFGARDYIKYRDIWDLQWLLQKNVKLNMNYVKNKISDYYIIDYSSKLETRFKDLENIIKNKKFNDEISRFLDQNTIQKTIHIEGFYDYIIEVISTLIKEVLKQL